jgi:hypothetical protein
MHRIPEKYIGQYTARTQVAQPDRRASLIESRPRIFSPGWGHVSPQWASSLASELGRLQILGLVARFNSLRAFYSGRFKLSPSHYSRGRCTCRTQIPRLYLVVRAIGPVTTNAVRRVLDSLPVGMEAGPARGKICKLFCRFLQKQKISADAAGPD